MPYPIAGIDVHKKMLAIVVADGEVDDDFHFERQKVGTTLADRRRLADWLVAHEVEEVVMESTAQYWRPVWEVLEQHWLVQTALSEVTRRSNLELDTCARAWTPDRVISLHRTYRASRPAS